MVFQNYDSFCGITGIMKKFEVYELICTCNFFKTYETFSDIHMDRIVFTFEIRKQFFCVLN